MSESFLSQEEVDALLEGVTGESQQLADELRAGSEVRAYSLSSQERIVRGPSVSQSQRQSPPATLTSTVR